MTDKSRIEEALESKATDSAPSFSGQMQFDQPDHPAVSRGIRFSLISVMVSLLFLSIAVTVFSTIAFNRLRLTMDALVSEHLSHLVPAQWIADETAGLGESLETVSSINNLSQKEEYIAEIKKRVSDIQNQTEKIHALNLDVLADEAFVRLDHFRADLIQLEQAITLLDETLSDLLKATEQREAVVRRVDTAYSEYVLAVEDATRQMRALSARAVAIDIPDAGTGESLYRRLYTFLEKEMSWLGTAHDLRTDGRELKSIAEAAVSAGASTTLENLMAQSNAVSLRMSVYKRLPNTSVVNKLASATKTLVDLLARDQPSSIFALRKDEIKRQQDFLQAFGKTGSLVKRVRSESIDLVSLFSDHVHQLVRETDQEVALLKWTLIGFTLLAALLSLFAIRYFVIQKVIKRVESLTSHMQKAALDIQHDKTEGLDNGLKQTLRSTGSDEIAMMGRSLVVLIGAIVRRDVSRAKADREARKQLKLSEQRLRQIIDLVPHFIFAKDRDGRFILVNQAVAEAYGTSVKNLIGKTDADFAQSEEEVKHFRVDDLEVINSGRMKIIHEEPITDTSGRKRLLTTTKIPFTFSGTSIPAVLGVSVDITDFRRAEEKREQLEHELMQAHKMDSVGRLAGGVAHDLNNMLAPIIGYAELLLLDLEDGHPSRQAVDQIVAAAERARDLVRQLLTFARKQAIEIKSIELNMVIAGFEKILRRTLREDVNIEIRLAPSPLMIQGDVGQIEQILLNLCINAQDAMAQGGDLIIETAAAALDGNDADSIPEDSTEAYVLMTVRDTGHGMDKETLEMIFEPFFTKKEVGKGTGLGLSTVYGIVKQHNGIIKVFSEPGTGTTFQIYFPYCDDLPASPTEDKKLETPMLGRETVLLVEDEDHVRELAVKLLRRYGYRVLAAHDGKTAVNVVKACLADIDLLVTDVILPDTNGKVLQEQIAAMKPGLKVLYMSGYTADVIGKHGVLETGLNFIQKPFSLQSFVDKVRSLIDHGRPPDEMKKLRS